MRALRASLFVTLALGAMACGGNSSVGSGGTGHGSSGSSGASTGSAATSTGSGGASSGSAGASTTTGGATTTTGGSGGSSGTTGSNVCDSQNCAVFASSDTSLYKVDPSNPASPTLLCTFGGDLTSSDVVTDIAVAPDLTLYAITTSALYTVDTTPNASGVCTATMKTSISGGTHWVGLTFTASGLLLGADSSGHVVTIDPTSGAISSVGNFGGTLVCSGDIVGINDANHTIYATAKDSSCSGSCPDKLVTLDPNNSYAATVVGDVGTSYAVYGLGYWGGKLYGFQHGGATLQIDPANGNTTLLGTGGDRYSGGATTPLAPIFQ